MPSTDHDYVASATVPIPLVNDFLDCARASIIAILLDRRAVLKARAVRLDAFDAHRQLAIA